MSQGHSNERLMMYALSLARKGYKKVFPNPPVGALLVKNGRIIATGFHGENGQDHAEIVALKKAKSLSSNSKLIVTLEPCNHFGKTPPCVNAILEAGVSEVVYGVSDPHSVASGGGVRLVSGGIKVVKMDFQPCFDFINPWKIFQNEGRKVIELWGIVSTNGLIYQGNFFDDDFKDFNNIGKKVVSILKKRTQVQCAIYSELGNDVYHANYPLNKLKGFNSREYKYNLQLLRVPVLADLKSKKWESFDLCNLLKFKSALRIGSGVIESYECEHAIG